MQTITPSNIRKAAKIKQTANRKIRKLLFDFLSLEKVNYFFSQNNCANGQEFIQAVLTELDLSIEFDKEGLNNIPLKDGFITISNNPYMGMEGVILLKEICAVRPDFKIRANYFLEKLEPLKSYFLLTNPLYENSESLRNNMGLHEAYMSILAGIPVGIFPSSKDSISNYNHKYLGDSKWSVPVLEIIKKSRLPVVPIYFHENLDLISHFSCLVQTNSNELNLHSELFADSPKTIKFTIGKPITVSEQERFDKIGQFGRYLRARTYALEHSRPINHYFRPLFIKEKHREPILSARFSSEIEQEIKLVIKNYLFFETDGYWVVSFASNIAPNLVKEIGRQREMAFRNFEVGSNKEIDIDEYDLYYDQLIILDKNGNDIICGCRIGKGKEILTAFGKKGFYINLIYRIKSGIIPVLRHSLEIGQVFVAKKHQTHTYPILLLLKGLLYYLHRNKSYRYIIGLVGFNNGFKRFSQLEMVQLIRMNYFNEEYALFVKPRKKYKIPKQEADSISLIKKQEDINKLQQYLSEVDSIGCSFQEMLKLFIDLNARVIGFNINPKNNDFKNGLMFIDLQKISEEMLKSLDKEFEKLDLFLDSIASI